MAISADGTMLYMGEQDNGCVQTKGTTNDMALTHVAGVCGSPCSDYGSCADGLADGAATFWKPHGVAVAPAAGPGTPIWVVRPNGGGLRVITHHWD